MANPGESTHPNRAAFPPGVSGPALRALSRAGVRGVADLGRWSEAELAALHGMGPKALGALGDALTASGGRFRGPALPPALPNASLQLTQQPRQRRASPAAHRPRHS